jgi:hypothetical protein
MRQAFSMGYNPTADQETPFFYMALTGGSGSIGN